MPRFKLTLEYDGAPFVGWQRQKNGLSVQEAIETALEALGGKRVKIRGAGRTDTGVHALGQVAHADLAKDWRADVLRDGLNAHMRPLPVAILTAERVPDTFDARFSAIRRHYLYRIVNRRAALDGRARPCLARQAQARCKSHAGGGAAFFSAAMIFQRFARRSARRKAPCASWNGSMSRGQATKFTSWRAPAPFFITKCARSLARSNMWGRANGVLRMLRAALEACDRRRCGMVAPPEGLYLASVDYGPQEESRRTG